MRLRANVDLKLNQVYVDSHQFANGSKYKGQMVPMHQRGDDDAATEVSSRHGFGINQYASGAVYMGQWQKDKTNGSGIFWHVNEDLYVGQFLEDQSDGFGIYIHKNGSFYSGQWKQDF